MSALLKVVEKAWGYEMWIHNGTYCGKRLVLHRGYRCSMHYHQDKHETFFVEQGRVLMEYGDYAGAVVGSVIRSPDEKTNTVVLSAGDRFVVPQRMWHRFTGIYDRDSVIFEFSTHHEDSDSYRAVGEVSGPAPVEVMNEYAL